MELGIRGRWALVCAGSLGRAFDTERLRATLAAGAARQQRDAAEVIEARRQAIPARRFGTAEEFGAFCAFLCSAQAGYLTGQNLLLDGGAYPGVF
jgi:3-oxoacyl-[acyl-carrier protein] reductase